MSKPTLIVSDLHLGAVPNEVRAAFLRFTQHWKGRAELLVINGDLFDFWCEFRTVVPNQHFHTLRALADLRDSGVRLVLVGGNHDAWGGAFLEEKIGIELADGPLELNLSGRRALIAHGDGLGPGDHGYKVLKRVIRSRPFRGFMRLVHPDIAWGIANHVSRTRERQAHGFAAARGRAGLLENYAEGLLNERPDLDLVILGHSHTPQLKEVDANRYYVNSGDWVVNRTYTVITEERVEQLEWEVAGGVRSNQ
jgi:UDP-2,3-diacylglucosamine hydrolase